MTMSPVKLFRFLNVALPAAKGVSDRSKERRAKRNSFRLFFWLSSDSKCVTLEHSIGEVSSDLLLGDPIGLDF